MSSIVLIAAIIVIAVFAFVSQTFSITNRLTFTAQEGVMGDVVISAKCGDEDVLLQDNTFTLEGDLSEYTIPEIDFGEGETVLEYSVAITNRSASNIMVSLDKTCDTTVANTSDTFGIGSKIIKNQNNRIVYPQETITVITEVSLVNTNRSATVDLGLAFNCALTNNNRYVYFVVNGSTESISPLLEQGTTTLTNYSSGGVTYNAYDTDSERLGACYYAGETIDLTAIKTDTLYASTTDSTNEKFVFTLNGSGKVRASIWFHKIVDIRIDDYGKLWIKTWGTSNLDAYGEPIHDAFWVREDLVVGKYIPCPAFLTNIVSFLGSNIGVVLLVIVPLGIVLFMLTIQFVDDLDRYKMEKRIQKNLVKIDDKMCQSKEIGYDLSAKNKYRVLLREEDDAKKIQFVHCMWRPKDIPRPIIKHLRKQNWKNREEDKHNKTLAKLLEQYKKTQDPKIIEKYQQEKERFENESFRKPQTTLSNPQKELTDEEYLSMLSKDKLKQVLKIRKKERKSEIRYLKRSLEKEKKMLEKGEEISGVSDEEHIPTANDEEKVELSPVEEKVTTVHKKAQTSTGRKPSNVAKKRTTQTTKVETKASSGKSNAKSGQESRAKTLAAGSTPKKKPVTKTSETKSTGTKASNTKTTPVKAKSAMGKSNSATK